MQPDGPNEEERLEELPEDNGTPFSAPSQPAGDGGQLDDTHPATDTNIQPGEVYEEGLAGAAEVSEKADNNGITSFTPPHEDQNSEKVND